MPAWALLAALLATGGPPSARLERTRELVRQHYVDLPPEAALVAQTPEGVMAALDSHSRYLSPAVYRAVRAVVGDGYGGIGVKLGPGGVILDRRPEGPAVKAGLQLGDRILRVDGASVWGLSPAELSDRLIGAAGQPILLELQPADGGPSYTRRLVRELLRWPSARVERVGEIGYLKIGGFGPQTPAEVDASLAALHRAGPLKGLILDLRDNPGGELRAAVRVADRWLKAGVIATLRRRGGTVRQDRAHPRGAELDYPMAVLINDSTASAAELLAAALIERGRARSFGAPSFGKSRVQTVMRLPGGAAIRLTVSRYLTPSGRSLEGRGLSPDQPGPSSEAAAEGEISLREQARLWLLRAAG